MVLEGGSGGGGAGGRGARVSGWRETMRVYVRDPEVAEALDGLGRGLASIVLLAGRRWLAEERPAEFTRLELLAAASDLEHVAGFLREIGGEAALADEAAAPDLAGAVEEMADEVLMLAAEVERVAMRLRKLAGGEGEAGGRNRGGEAPGGGAR